MYKYQNIQLYDRLILNYFTYTRKSDGKEFISPLLRYFEKETKEIFKGRYPNVREYLQNRYTEFGSYKETLIRMYYNIDEHPVCQICGKPAKFYGAMYKPYCFTCSKECNKKLQIQHCEDTKEKRYNNRHYCNPDKAADTLEAKYGYRRLSQIPEFKAKADNTREKKFGNKCMLLTEKAKQGNYKKYGTSTWNQTKEGKRRQKEISNRPEVKQKSYETKKRNGTLNTSAEEIAIKDILKTKYVVYSNYSEDKRYPFSVDYYLPELDLFIEYQGHPTHGNHPFDKNNPNDIEEVKSIVQKIEETEVKWKEKDPNFRSNLREKIKTWCSRDVFKRETAKKNGINFIEIWGMEDVYDFLIMMKIPKETISEMLYQYKHRIQQLKRGSS